MANNNTVVDGAARTSTIPEYLREENWTRFEDVKHITTEEYFQGNQFAIDAFNKKYAHEKTDGRLETIVEAYWRVATYLASVEKTKKLQDYWGRRIFHEIFHDWWQPAGSIMQGAAIGIGVSMSNCTTCSAGLLDETNEWDNLESIYKNLIYTVAKTAAYRQGLGVDFSRLRPRDTHVSNSAKVSEGAVHWMKAVDQVGYQVGQRARIPAMLFSLNIRHPDVEEFITVKQDYTKIQNANISVQITDDFYEAVEKDQAWDLKFDIPEVKKGQKIYLDVHSIDSECQQDEKGRWYKIARRNRKGQTIRKTVQAKALLELLAKNMASHAEPGIQNIDLARKFSNSDYVYDPDHAYNSRILSTNACVPSDVPILTRDGYQPIVELVNREVEVWNGKEWSTVTPKITQRGEIPLVRVHLSDGSSLTCTPNHKWHVTSRIFSRDAKIVETAASNLKKGDRLVKYQMPIVDSSEFCDFEHAYTHGFWCGDGQYNNHENKGALLYGEKKALAPHLESNSDPNEISGDRIWLSFPKAMASKFAVPLNHSLKSRIEWLAGYLDADGTLTRNKNSMAIQMGSVNLEFLQKIRLMLTTLGIQAKIGEAREAGTYNLPDGKGGSKEYECQKIWRLVLNASDTYHLVHNLGMKTHRLKLEAQKPQRDARHFVRVEKVEAAGTADEVFCFTEPLNHTGCFNGIITGQCSEQYLSRESLCVLSSINAAKFSTDPEIYEQEFSIIGESINRALDNVNECELVYETYATPHQRLAIESLRRTGAGVTNLAAWLFKNNLEYGSAEGNSAAAHFNERYNYHLYRSSIELGKEKGSFGLFVREKYEQSPFVQHMISLGLEFEAMRNVTCSSWAPTGTLTTQFTELAMSYGAEPAFGLYYWKRTRISGSYEYYFCVPRVVRDYFASKGSPIPMDRDAIKDSWDGKHGNPIAKFIDTNKDRVGIRFKSALEVSPKDKVDLMGRLMENCDSSISITYTLPEGTDWKEVYNFILEARKRGVKSIAAFPDKKMYGIVSFIDFKSLALKLRDEGVTIYESNFSNEELAELNMSREAIHTKVDTPPKRLKELEADIYVVTVKSKKYVLVIGKQNGHPYEMFGGHMTDELKLPQGHREGLVKKIKRGHYQLEVGDKVFENFSKEFEPVEQMMFRMVSLSMRHGIPIRFIVEQLEKGAQSSENGLGSLNAAARRVLKKYIRDGEKVSGTKCPMCGSSDLVYSDGCVSCACGWTKCS